MKCSMARQACTSSLLGGGLLLHLPSGLPAPSYTALWRAAPAGPRPKLKPLLRLPSCSPDAQLPTGASSQRQAGYQAAFTESEDEADLADIPASPDGEPGPPEMVATSKAGTQTAPVKVQTLLDSPASPGEEFLGLLIFGFCLPWAMHQATDHIINLAKQVRSGSHLCVYCMRREDFLPSCLGRAATSIVSS